MKIFYLLTESKFNEYGDIEAAEYNRAQEEIKNKPMKKQRSYDG